MANLLLRTARARVGHDVNRVDRLTAVVLRLHAGEHFVRDAFGQLRPNLDDLVVALAVRNRAVEVLLLDRHDVFLRTLDKPLLFRRHDHVVNAHRNPGLGGVLEAQVLELVDHLDRLLAPEAQVAVLHQLGEALLLQEAVDEGHLIRQVIVENDAPHRRIQVLLGELDRLGVQDVLVVESVDQVDDAAAEVELDRRQRLDVAHVER